MFRIKRQKGKSVHYATKVTLRGTIEGWSPDPMEAQAVSEAGIERVKDRHRTVPVDRLGVFTFEKVTPTVKDLVQAEAADQEFTTKQIRQMQDEVRRLTAENEALVAGGKEKDKALIAAAQSAKEAVDDLRAKLGESDQKLAAKCEEVSSLRARIAQMEASAQPSANGDGKSAEKPAADTPEAKPNTEAKPAADAGGNTPKK